MNQAEHFTVQVTAANNKGHTKCIFFYMVYRRKDVNGCRSFHIESTPTSHPFSVINLQDEYVFVEHKGSFPAFKRIGT